MVHPRRRKPSHPAGNAEEQRDAEGRAQRLERVALVSNVCADTDADAGNKAMAILTLARPAALSTQPERATVTLAPVTAEG